MRVVLLKSRARVPGGLEKTASRIAGAFTERGAEVTVLTSGDPTSDPAIVSTRLAPWPAFYRMEQFDRFVRHYLSQNPSDLVFGMDRNRYQTHFRAGNGVHDAYLKSRIATEGRLKYLSCLCNPMHRKILELEKTAFEHPGLKKLFTNSQMVKNEILSRFATDPAKIEVIHNGVEWREMQADFDLWTAQKRPEPFQFLFIGNGYLRKGLGQLLEALARLQNRDFELSVIGKDRRLEQYRAKAVALGLEKKVRFFGPRTDIRSFYQIADLLVIPSFYDPFANVTVEALAMGLYVVSSKHNGGSEILTSENGALIPELTDIDSLADTLERSMAHRKTFAGALKIRESVAHLDYQHQMHRLVEACYGS